MQRSRGHHPDVLPLSEAIRGSKMDQAKRLKELEKEHGKSKWLLAQESLDKKILKDSAGETLSPSDVRATSSIPAKSTR